MQSKHINSLYVIGTLSSPPPPPPLSFAYEHFQTKLYVICFLIQLLKCVALSPFGLLPNFNTPS
jgi:hypothetical protein